MNRNELAGGALAVGFLFVLVVLYRDPASGVAAATTSVSALLYFVVLPTIGVLAGLYAFFGGRYAVVPLFLFGSYLGAVGIALVFGGALATPSAVFLIGAGIALVSLSLMALLGGVLQVVPSVRLASLPFSLD